MQKLIERLYGGEIFPFEEMKTVVEGYSDAVAVAKRLENDFREDLSDSMKEKWDEIKDKRATADMMEIKQAFVDGFKLGTCLTAESYSKKEL